MSRCFPFPPPGYLRNNGACSEDLMIKSIKLQKERDETKEQRKKDKKKRKEKRKERKERKEKESKAALHTDDKGKECKVENLESSKLEKVKTEQGTGCLQKVGNEENEQNERSAITEEHDQPFSSTEPCCLSDSTQTSNKRKRSESPCNSDHGTAFKIRIPLRKHQEPEELQQNHHRGSSESNIISRSVIEEPHHQVPRQDSESKLNVHQYSISAGTGPSTSNTRVPSTSTQLNVPSASTQLDVPSTSTQGDCPSTSTQRDCPSTSTQRDCPSTSTQTHPSKRTKHRSERGKMAALYKSLIVDWDWSSCGPQINGFELDDQDDWLFASKRQKPTPATKKVEAVKDSPQCSSATLWPPRAQYLAEADIYALPYVVPF